MLRFQLADRLHKTVAELEATLTLEEMAGWIAYSERSKQQS